jgi:hypothetical protein
MLSDHLPVVCFRTKWKRQTQVGMELLAEAGNYAAVQRMLQTNPYWSAYAPHTASIMSNLDALYFRHGSGAPGVPGLPPRPVLPRMFIHGLQQHVSHLPPPPSALYGSPPPPALSTAPPVRGSGGSGSDSRP